MRNQRQRESRVYRPDYSPNTPQASDAQKREMGQPREADVTPAAFAQWKANRR